MLRKEIRALTRQPRRATCGSRPAAPWYGWSSRTTWPRRVTGDALVRAGRAAACGRWSAGTSSARARRCSVERTFLRWDRTGARPSGRPATTGRDRRSTNYPGPCCAGRASGRAQLRLVAPGRRGGGPGRQVLGRGHNEHRPTEYAPYLDGDPRNEFSRGVRIDLSTAIHAEAAVVARAAGDGLTPAGRRPVRVDLPVPGLRPADRRGRLRAGATSPARTRCWTATRCCGPPGVELIWVDPADPDEG